MPTASEFRGVIGYRNDGQNIYYNLYELTDFDREYLATVFLTENEEILKCQGPKQKLIDTHFFVKYDKVKQRVYFNDPAAADEDKISFERAGLKVICLDRKNLPEGW